MKIRQFFTLTVYVSNKTVLLVAYNRIKFYEPTEINLCPLILIHCLDVKSVTGKSLQLKDKETFDIACLCDFIKAVSWEELMTVKFLLYTKRSCDFVHKNCTHPFAKWHERNLWRKILSHPFQKCHKNNCDKNMSSLLELHWMVTMIVC